MSKINIFPDPIVDYDFENVYRPADDTYLVVDYFKHHIDFDFFDGIPIENIKKILDMGTGTGYIALSFQIIKTIIPKFKPKIYASDILEEAINLSKHNERLNSFENEIEFIKSDLFKLFPKHLKHSFDVIIFNPPYLPSFEANIEKNNKLKIDHSWNGGNEGFAVFLRFLDVVKEYLNLETESRIYYVCSSRTDLNRLYSLIKKMGFKNRILEKHHIFLEDIFINRLEVSID